MLLTQYLMYDLDPGLENKLASKLLEGSPYFLGTPPSPVPRMGPDQQSHEVCGSIG